MSGNQYDWVRAMVVDDEQVHRELLRDVLRLVGIKDVTYATNGAKALERIWECKPNLMFLDVRMNEMDGMEVVEFLRNDPASPNPNIPIIMVTSFTTPETIERLFAAGVNGIVKKPFTVNDAKVRIEKVLADLDGASEV